jgi:hypothetical protein
MVFWIIECLYMWIQILAIPREGLEVGKPYAHCLPAMLLLKIKTCTSTWSYDHTK